MIEGCDQARQGQHRLAPSFLEHSPRLLPACVATVCLHSSLHACRCSVEDLERERGPVMEEWRGQRSASGRSMQALWKLMHEGSKYADRMPIGLESVIQNVSADTVRAFYQKWYHPHNMAVIVVGDFEVLPLPAARHLAPAPCPTPSHDLHAVPSQTSTTCNPDEHNPQPVFSVTTVSRPRLQQRCACR